MVYGQKIGGKIGPRTMCGTFSRQSVPLINPNPWKERTMYIRSVSLSALLLVFGCSDELSSEQGVTAAMLAPSPLSIDRGRPLEPRSVAGEIWAEPDEHPLVSPGDQGGRTICWEKRGVRVVEVWVKQQGKGETLLAQAKDDTCKTVSWIESGTTYRFRMYAGSSKAEILDTVYITGVAL